MLKSLKYEKYLKPFFKLMNIPEERRVSIKVLIQKGRDAQIGVKDWKKLYFFTKTMFEF